MSSLKTNVVLNFVNTLTGIVFPVITFPYAARILLPEGIGTVNFLQSIVSYIVLLTSLGIPMYAVREVARYRDDEHKRNVTTVEIILLSILLCLGGYVIVWLLGEYVPQVNAQLALFYVLSLTILFTSLGVNWFYQAVEDFKFITVRALVFRFLAMISLFVFVKTKDDLLAYALISVGASVGNNIINFIHLRKYVSFRQLNWSELRIWRHLRPSLHIFVFNLITSIYLNLNTVMLGFMQGDSAVGLYTAGNKISHIVLMVVASLGVVMLPRCANLIERGQLDEFASVTRKSYRFVTALSLPVTLGLMLLAVPVIALFCGQEFSDAVPVLYWTAPVIIFISLSNVFGIQILYPQGQENLVIWSTVGGAVFNFILNLWLIPLWSYTGAAISTFVAELVVLLIQVLWGKRYIPFPMFDKSHLHYMLAAVVMVICLLPLFHFITGAWLQLIACSILGILIYSAVLWLFKDELFKEMLQYAVRFVRH